MEKFSLKWNDFQTTVSNSFRLLKQEKDFFDVTLVTDDQKQIQSHKVVLSACSSFFKPILQNNIHSHPLIYLSGINSINLQLIIDYVYEGEVQLFQEQLDSFLEAAQKLQIAGLLSNQKDEIGKLDDDFVTETKFNNREVVEDENNFKVSGINSQNKKVRNKTIVTVSGHDKDEVKKKIEDIMTKEDDFFKCTVCGKMSKDKSNMKKHIEIHIEGLSYVCEFCNTTFR